MNTVEFGRLEKQQRVEIGLFVGDVEWMEHFDRICGPSRMSGKLRLVLWPEDATRNIPRFGAVVWIWCHDYKNYNIYKTKYELWNLYIYIYITK